MEATAFKLRCKKEKVHKVIECPLPPLNKLIKIYPRDRYGNEAVIIKKGKFISSTKNLMIFQTMENKLIECYSKSDLKLGIYLWDHLHENLSSLAKDKQVNG